jgi:hypothetical protein
MIPRLKSKIWIDALLRQLLGQGNFGAVIHKGAEEAGTIFIAVNRLDQTYDLLVPAIGAGNDEDGERLFEKHSQIPQSWPEINTHVERQRKFDADLWLVEIELRQGFAHLKLVSDRTNF